jgi:hypothetical protein
MLAAFERAADGRGTGADAKVAALEAQLAEMSRQQEEQTRMFHEFMARTTAAQQAESIQPAESEPVSTPADETTQSPAKTGKSGKEPKGSK